jgi:hypothetical protein
MVRNTQRNERKKGRKEEGKRKEGHEGRKEEEKRGKSEKSPMNWDLISIGC